LGTCPQGGWSTHPEPECSDRTCPTELNCAKIPSMSSRRYKTVGWILLVLALTIFLLYLVRLLIVLMEENTHPSSSLPISIVRAPALTWRVGRPTGRGATKGGGGPGARPRRLM